MGNTPTAKKGNEMESGEYLPPGNKCSSVRLSFDRCVQESVCCHSQLVSATSLTCNAQGPIALRCIALFIPERRPVIIIVPSLSFLKITWLFINIKLFVCLLRRPFLCEAILACEVSSWRILGILFTDYVGRTRDEKPKVKFRGTSEDDNNSLYTTSHRSLCGSCVCRCFFLLTLPSFKDHPRLLQHKLLLELSATLFFFFFALASVWSKLCERGTQFGMSRVNYSCAM